MPNDAVRGCVCVATTGSQSCYIQSPHAPTTWTEGQLRVDLFGLHLSSPADIWRLHSSPAVMGSVLILLSISVVHIKHGTGKIYYISYLVILVAI